MVMTMRKRIIIMAILLFLIGGMIIINSTAEEKVVPGEEDYALGEIARKHHENNQRLLSPIPPIEPITIFGISMVLVGVMFLVKSKDQDFLPGI